MNKAWSAVRLGLYQQHLAGWLRHFPRAQMLFLDGEQLIRDPAGQVNRVERFLGLRPGRWPSARHPAVVRPQDFVLDAVKKFPCVRRANSSVPRCLGATKGRVHPRVEPELLRRLARFYRPHNLEFFRLIDQHFAWS